GRGPERVSAREELRELAGPVPAAPGQRGEDLQAPDAPRGQPGGAGVADGGAGLPPREERAGGVLPSHPGALRGRQGGGGDGAETGGAGVPDAEAWAGVCAADPGGVRGGLPTEAGEGACEERVGAGLQAGTRGGESVSARPARRRPAAKRLAVATPNRVSSGGGEGEGVARGSKTGENGGETGRGLKRLFLGSPSQPRRRPKLGVAAILLLQSEEAKSEIRWAPRGPPCDR